MNEAFNMLEIIKEKYNLIEIDSDDLSDIEQDVLKKVAKIKLNDLNISELLK